MKEKLKQLKAFQWNLFISLCALSLLPAIYQTIKTYIISSTNEAPIFDIIGQMEWFDLINETLRAFLIIPLYSVLNKIMRNDRENFAKYIFKIGIITFILYTLFSIIVFIYGIFLIKAMNPNEVDIHTVNRYLQLETVAFMLQIIVAFVNVVFIVVGKSKNVYIFLAIQTILSILADCVFIPNFGVYGVAIANIVVYSLLAIVSVLLLYLQKYMQICWYNKKDTAVLKEWGKIGFYAGIQQFIDNFIYAVMVVKMVNIVAEQGNYWIANNFIWGWLLIPITALTEIIRSDCKNGYKDLKQLNYYLIATSVVLLWCITIPLWILFFKYVEKLQNAQEVFFITIKLVPFYIAYCIYAIIDNIFIGLGKTVYNGINSLVINVIYYGVFFLCFKVGVIDFHMNTIICMFGFGMVVHLVVSMIEQFIFYQLERKKENIMDKIKSID